MKTAGRENPNRRGRLRTEPSPWGGKSESSSLIHTGWKVRKHPAMGEVFFLTFSFIELHGTSRRSSGWTAGNLDVLDGCTSLQDLRYGGCCGYLSLFVTQPSHRGN